MLELIACAALSALTGTSIDLEQVRARAVACRQEHVDRLMAGADDKITADLPAYRRSALLEARSLTALDRLDSDRSGGWSYGEWEESAWEFELLYDSNRDGQVSREEYLSGRSATASTSDADYASFVGALGRDHQRRFQRLSRRGMLDRSMLANEARATFRRYDSNRDGEISPDEVRNGVR